MAWSVRVGNAVVCTGTKVSCAVCCAKDVRIRLTPGRITPPIKSRIPLASCGLKVSMVVAVPTLAKSNGVCGSATCALRPTKAIQRSAPSWAGVA